uniref:T9SS type A sorting domain-containing protein n=1 Tax=Carboxylicivirga fragile TaxID=3417571 RepID=UPI003D34E128|nr:T9SS type A sorting domain-containing protein [Marinilabiliaceae bacterium N1Y90]
FEAGQHSISIDGLSNFDATRSVYLEDKETGAIIDMRSTNSYTFDTQKGDFNNRLVLLFDNAATATDIGDVNDEGAKAYIQNTSLLVIECDWLTDEKSVSLYTIGGQLITQKRFNTNIYEIDVNDLSSGLYIVKINSDDKTYTQKVIIE